MPTRRSLLGLADGRARTPPTNDNLTLYLDCPPRRLLVQNPSPKLSTSSQELHPKTSSAPAIAGTSPPLACDRLAGHSVHSDQKFRLQRSASVQLSAAPSVAPAQRCALSLPSHLLTKYSPLPSFIPACPLENLISVTGSMSS